MSPLEQVALGFQTLARALGRLGDRAPWAPFVPLAALRALAVGVVWGAAHPALSWFAAPLLDRAAGPRALHYPDAFAMLPAILAPFDLLLAVVIGPVVIGAATLLFASRFGEVPMRPGAAAAAALRRAPALVLTALPAHLLVLAFGLVLGRIPPTGMIGVLVHRVGVVAVIGAGVVVQALVLYTPALVLIEGRGLWATFAALPRAWSRGLITALVLTLLVLVPLTPFDWPMGHALRLTERGRPEMVAVLALVRIAVTLVGWFVLAGAATLAFLSAVLEAGPRRRA